MALKLNLKKVLPQKNVVRVKSIPAPVGGWNARDALAHMDELDASELVNFFPNATDVELRHGSQNVNGVSTLPIESVMALETATISKMLVATNNTFYVIASDHSATVTGASNSNNRFQHINFANSAGQFLYFVNGQDIARYWDGTSFTEPSITGVTSSNLININAFKNRIWFVENNSLSAWYLPTGQLSGAASELDLGPFCTKGGYLMAMATWTIDAGFGMDDLAVFITSAGEALVYRGTDPSSSASWALVGVFYIGVPLGRRCFTKFKGDLLIITHDGLVPMSKAILGVREKGSTLTDKIDKAIGDATALYGDQFGWQVIHSPKHSQIILNVPVPGASEQYVMNTVTGSWCRFTDQPAMCWEIWNEDLYFGSSDSNNGALHKAWTGTSDDGVAITGSALQAFNDFGNPGQEKRFTMIRPTFFQNGSLSVEAKMNLDFDIVTANSSYQTIAPTAGVALWDSAVWDTDTWAPDTSPARPRLGARGVGFWAAPKIGAQSSSVHFSWVSTDVLFEPGSPL